MRYYVVSPDALRIEPRTYPSEAAARAALAAWCERFTAPGYYAAASGERIPVAELEGHCRVLPTLSRLTVSGELPKGGRKC